MAKKKAVPAPVEPVARPKPAPKSKLTSYRFSIATDTQLSELTSRLGLTRTALIEASVAVFREAIDRAEINPDKIPK